MSRRPSPLSMPLFPSGPLVDTKAPGIELRKYQQAVIDRLRAHVTPSEANPTPKKRCLLVAPCASGKMVMMASMMRTSSLPLLFVAHRQELLQQCVDQLAALGMSHVSVIRGDDNRYDPHASVHVASIDSLARRKPKEAGLIFIDEAHRSLAPSYEQHVFDAYPESIIIGATASPCRLDNKPLGDRYEVMEIAASYGELLKAGHLVEPVVYEGPIIADLSSVRINDGDFNAEELGRVMSQTHLRGQLLVQWQKLSHLHQDPRTGQWVPGERRKTIIFAVNVAHSRLIAADWAASGVRIAHLDGMTPEDDRRRMLADLASGKLEAITNVNVLTEGVDIPSIKCVVHACPTASLVRWIQSTNRALRLWQGMTPMIIDHAGNRERHGFPTEDRAWSLKSQPTRFASAEPVQVCPMCFMCNGITRYLCAGCGFEFPREVAPKKAAEIPTETDEDLVAVTEGEIRKAFYVKMVAKAKSKGFKPTQPSVKFKEKYGVWPPDAWKFETDLIFHADPVWKEALERRQKLRDFYDAGKAPAPAIPAAFDGVAEGGTYICLTCFKDVDIGFECPTCHPQHDPLAVAPEADPWQLAPHVDAGPQEEAPFADWLEGENIR